MSYHISEYYIEEIPQNYINAEKLIRKNPDNYKIIKKQIKKNFNAFKYVSDRLKNDFDFVKHVVNNDGLQIKYASDNLKNNYKIAITAISNNDFAYKFISDKLKKDTTIINLVGKIHAHAIKFLPDKSYITLDFINNIIDNSCYLYFDFVKLIPKKLLTQDICLKLVKRNDSIFYDIPKKFINNDIIYYIIKQKKIIFLLDRNINITEEIILYALKLNKEDYSYIPKNFLNKKSFILKMVAIDSDFICLIPPKLQNDCDIIICAINNNKKFTQHNNVLLYNQVWNIQWNFNKFEKHYIEILENIKYMPYTNNIEKLLNIIFSDTYLKNLILNTDKYSNYLIELFKYYKDNTEDYVLIFEKYNIRFINFIDFRPCNTNVTDEEIKQSLIEHNPNKNILWY
jgi:hypothetical protein